MNLLRVNDFNELHEYHWNNSDCEFKLCITENQYITVEVYKNEILVDMNVISDFNFDNVNEDLFFIEKYGLKVVINEELLKLKYKIKYIISEINKRKIEFKENKSKDWVYDRHDLYEFEVKEECLNEVLSLLSILDNE